MQPLELNKLISLTFDESPSVRKRAALSLAEIDDPAAIFALMELSYDKEPSVRQVSLQILEKRKQSEAEVMSFAELFSTHSTKSASTAVMDHHTPESKDKVLQPITRLFEKHLGKERAEAVRTKMMPSIEKIYLKAVEPNRQHSEETGRRVMQEFLTSYLEVISDLDQVSSGGSSHGQQLTPLAEPKQQTQQIQQTLVEITPRQKQAQKEEPLLAVPIPETESRLIDIDVKDLIVDLKEEEGVSSLPDTFFRKAYELMMLSDGDEDIMRKEMKRMISDAEHEIALAFKLARKKFREVNITNISKIKDGMRNINTDVLTVKAVEQIEYKKNRKEKGILIRILVNDPTGNEGVIYLFNGKTTDLKPSLKIKITAGTAKSFDFSRETVIVPTKKSNIYIVL